MYFVYSTLSTNMIYANYEDNSPNSAAAVQRVSQVLIRGGANIAQEGFSKTQTVPGVVTEITDEQYAFIKDHPSFLAHVKNGFVTAIDSKAALDVVAADMEEKAEDAQLTDADFKEGGRMSGSEAPSSVGSVSENN